MSLSDIVINQNFSISVQELSISFCRSGGPGGQNVNKVNTKAVLRWHFSQNLALSDDVKERIRKYGARYLTNEGDIVISSSEFRVQSQNLEECIQKLTKLVQKAFVVPKKRVKTKITEGAKEERIEYKKKVTQKKKMRDKRDYDD